MSTIMKSVLLQELYENGELSPRTYRVLTNAGYRNLQEIRDLSAAQILDIKNLGTKSIEELNQLTEKYEEDTGGRRLVFWKREQLRSIDISDLTTDHFLSVGDLMDACEKEYVHFSDICAVYRYLQQNCTPDEYLKPLRRRMVCSAPNWILDLPIDWKSVTPQLEKILKKKSCKTIFDLTILEQQHIEGLDSAERVELKNLIDDAMTQTGI